MGFSEVCFTLDRRCVWRLIRLNRVHGWPMAGSKPWQFIGSIEGWPDLLAAAAGSFNVILGAPSVNSKDQTANQGTRRLEPNSDEPSRDMG
jgi:hypothetical protein